MSNIKPIQATPELKGSDAIKLINEVNKTATPAAMKRNQMLCNVLTNIQK